MSSSLLMAPDPRQTAANSAAACVRLPSHALTRAGFDRWAQSVDFPDHCQISWISGEIVIDMSPEEIESHNKLKTEITRVIATLVKQQRLGEFFSDRAWICNEEADLSTEPDAMFASRLALQTGKLRKVRNDNGLVMSLAGTPDWVVELVSRTSVAKDTKWLKLAYQAAGVSEYWVIDARRQKMQIQVFSLGKSGYKSIAVKRGRWKSPVFGLEFHLWRELNEFGFWDYTLDHR